MFNDNDGELEVKGGSDRSFGLVFTSVFTLVAVWPLMGNWNDLASVRVWAILVAGIVLLASFVWPKFLSPANRVWTKLGILLNKIVSPLVLGVLFFVVLTPVSYFMRLRGKDILQLKRSRVKETYWVLRDDEVPSSMDNQF